MPTHLANFFVQPKEGSDITKSVWPDREDKDEKARPAVAAGYVSWPGLPWATGGVHVGTPPGGDFVPHGSVGLGYVSPGYLPPSKP